MGSPYEHDMGGMTLLVKEIKTGYNSAHGTGTSANTVAGGSALTVTRASHLGKIIKLDTASGTTITLPDATGSGDTYVFVVTTSVTSNNHVIKVANASDTMIGTVAGASGAAVGTAVIGDIASGTDDTITMNGTTSGGLIGTWYELTDVSDNVWHVKGLNAYSGNAVAIFSATVA